MRGPIETYLDKLVVELQGPGHEIRGILAEVEDHLTEAAAAGVAEGLDAQEAERRAVARFGSPRRLAHKFVPPPSWSSWCWPSLSWAASDSSPSG